MATKTHYRPVIILGAMLAFIFVCLWSFSAFGALTAGETCFATANGGVTLFQSVDASAVQQAVDAAPAGGVVKVAGTCVGVTTYNFGGTIPDYYIQTAYISKTLTLSGGYTTTNWVDSLPLTQPTVLDADGGGRVIYATQNLTVTAMTLQNGIVSNVGGGLMIGGSLVLSDVNLYDNTATDSNGGGVYAANGAVVTGGSFQGNRCLGDCSGGGLSSDSGALLINGTQFSNNSAGTSGGGVYAGASLGLTDTTFTGNAAGFNGGGAYFGGDADVAGSAFTDNTAGHGGGAYFSSTTVVAKSTFVDNQADGNANVAESFDGATVLTLSSGWSSSTTGVGVNWVVTDTQAHSAPNSVFAPAPNNIGSSALNSPVFTPTVGGGTLSFWLRYNTENAYDGTVLEIKIGAGSFQDIVVAGGSFVEGAYTGTIYNSGLCCGNPLAGRDGWTGNSDGWIHVLVSLPTTTAGQSTQLRWRVGSDNSIAGLGVWLDDIEVRTPPGLGGGAYFVGANAKELVNVLLAGNSASGNGAALYVTNATPLDVVHSTIASPTLIGNEAVYVAGGTVNVLNTVIASHTAGIARAGGSATEDFVLFDDVATPLVGTVQAGANSFSGLAAFQDTTDYFLSDASMAINRGTNAGITDDFAGDVRPAGGGFDIGYDESSFTTDVGIVKEVLPTTAGPGAEVTYVLSFSNTGTGPASGIEISDNVPVTVTVTGVTSSTYGASFTIDETSGNPNFVWSVSDLAVGAGGVITLTGTLDESIDLYGTEFVNTATISANSDFTSTNNSSSALFTAIDAPMLEIVKDVDNASPEETDTITYTVVVSNLAATTATGVEINDSETGNLGTGLTLAGGEVISYTYAVSKDDGPLTVVNTATVTSDQTIDPLSSSVSVEWQNVAPTAALSNDGPVTYPATAQVSFASQSDPSTADTNSGFVYSYDFDNDGTFEISGSSAPTATVPLGFMSGVSSRTVRGRIADKDGGYTDYTTDITVVQPVLVITKSVTKLTPSEGGTVTYKIVVSNTGTGDATGVDIDDSVEGTLASGIGLVAGGVVTYTYAASEDDGPLTVVNTATVTSDQTDPATSSVSVVWQNVAPTAALSNDGPANFGETAEVSFASQSDPSTADTNSGFVYSYDFDNDGTFEISGSSAPTATVPLGFLSGVSSRTVRGRIADKDGGYTDYTTNITVVQPVLVIAKLVTKLTQDEGGTVTYAVVVSNTGTGGATGVDIDDSVEGTLASGISLAAGEVVTYTYAASEDDGPLTVVNTATVTSDQTDPATSSVSVQWQNVAPTAALGNDGPANFGETAEVSFASQSDPSTADTNSGFVYSYDFDNDGTFEISESSAPTATVPLEFLSSVSSRTVRGRIADKDGGYTDYTTDITVVQPVLVISKSVTQSTPNEGGTITYKVVISNTGTAGATGVEVYDTEDGLLGSDISLPVGAQLTYFYEMGEDDGPLTVVNTATVTSDQTDPVSSSVSVEWQNVAPTAALSNDGPASYGETAEVSFASQSDPSTADTGSGFVYSYDFDNDGTFEISESSAATATVPLEFLSGVSSRTVRGRIADKDGDYNDYTTTVIANEAILIYLPVIRR